MTAISSKTSRPRIGPVAVPTSLSRNSAKARVLLTPARVLQSIGRGEQEQREEEYKEQRER
jgi:hypothetical protein